MNVDDFFVISKPPQYIYSSTSNKRTEDYHHGQADPNYFDEGGV
jgi:hypothetical protein